MAELYLVEFKGSRKEYFFNTYYHTLKTPEYVITEAERGEDLGILLKKIEVEIELPDDKRPRSILRRASPDDINRMLDYRRKEEAYKHEVVEMIRRHQLIMKVVDVECQFDGNKMTIYFTADHRVDFRELVKDLAARYRTRIELRQIGVRDEARRIGGLGICGKIQCCNSFIRDFTPISTQHAREQDLPLNPAKISGNCGRLLCCLRYEADMYSAVKKHFPRPGSRVRTKQGDGVVERIDIFKEETVVRTEDNTFFRCRLSDVLDVGAAVPAGPPSQKSIIEEYEEGAMDEGERDRALKDLEDSTNGN